MTFLRRAFAPLLMSLTGLTVGLVVGCTAITLPNDDVQRCDNVDDCDDPDDNRFDAQCIKEDNDIPGVCVAILKEDVGCDETNPIFMEETYAQVFEEFGNSSRYNDGCEAMGMEGAAGCAPGANGQCQSGLQVNGNGVCDDQDSNTPPAIGAGPEHVGQDIRDQHCRSYFCDVSFVCDRSNPNKPICKPCDPSKNFGLGGCGNLYMNGAPSCIYQAKNDVENAPACKAPDSDPLGTVFGACM